MYDLFCTFVFKSVVQKLYYKFREAPIPSMFLFAVLIMVAMVVGNSECEISRLSRLSSSVMETAEIEIKWSLNMKYYTVGSITLF